MNGVLNFNGTGYVGLIQELTCMALHAAKSLCDRNVTDGEISETNPEFTTLHRHLINSIRRLIFSAVRVQRRIFSFVEIDVEIMFSS